MNLTSPFPGDISTAGDFLLQDNNISLMIKIIP